MKKLIELLNEYMKYKEKFGPDKLTRFKGIDISGNLLFELKNGEYFQEEYIISKKFGFIKWLVDNDKINFTNLQDNGDWYDINTQSEYFDMLALLSIQDNPIEFLVMILK